MGGLFSRAFKRITQSNQQRSRNDSQSDQSNQQQSDPTRARSLVEHIPVGQSIDSAEYRDLEGNNKSILSPQTGDDHKENNNLNSNNCSRQQDDEKKQDVEEAVIKIQALVRGHLTRKALKDANQPANGLGQSQFDEESLTKNLGDTLRQRSHSIGLRNDTGKSQLESIAEVVETTASSIGASVQQTAKELAELISRQAQAEQESQHTNNNSTGRRAKLASICQSRAEKHQQQQQPQQPGDASLPRQVSLGREETLSVSPAPSEANASIDLGTCDTPASASASIDILDHNIEATDRLARVLHPNQGRQEQAPAPTGTAQAPVELTIGESTAEAAEIQTPDSLADSEEAAAIRIQSAFRGYRTRKNSPYRTRSPNSINGNGHGNGNGKLLRQQEAVVANDEQLDEPDDGAHFEPARRESRAKQRDADEQARSADQSISGLDSATEDTVKEVPSQQNVAELSGSQLADTFDDLDADVDGRDDNAEQQEEGDETAVGCISAALEAAPSSAISGPNDRRISSSGGPKAASSSFDTDSSYLGAALSLNEEVSLAAAANDHKLGAPDGSEGCGALIEPADDEDTIELELEARRLVDELAQESPNGRRRDEPELAATNQLELCPDEDGDEHDEDDELDAGVDAQEQLATELESDDIERRDPRGQASEERARSPQISTELVEPVDLVLGEQDELVANEQADQNNGQPTQEVVNSDLLAGTLDRANASGRSTPAIDSSNGDDEEDADDDSDNNGHHHQQQQQTDLAGSSRGPGENGPAQVAASKSKRRNRNKRRAKK